MRLFYGKSRTGKTRAIYEELKAALEIEPLGQPIFLVVPIASKKRIEAELADFLGKGFFRVEVVSLKELLLKYALPTLKQQLIAPITRYTLLLEILAKNDFHFFPPAKTSLIVELDRILQDLELAKISTNKGAESEAKFNAKVDISSYEQPRRSLAKIIPTLTNSLLAQKLTEIEQIANEYELAKAQAGLVDYAEIIAYHLRKPLIKNTAIYLDSPADFSPLEIDLLKELDKQNQLTLALTMTKEQGLFRTAKKIYTALSDIIEKEREFSSSFYANSDLAKVQEFFLCPRATTSSSSIELFVADNLILELEGIARLINNLLLDGKYKAKDIAVVTTDAAYKSYLPLIFQKYNLPFRIDSCHKANSPLIELVKILPKIQYSSLTESVLFELVKLDILPLHCQEKVVNYLLATGKRTKEWQKDWNIIGKNFDQITPEDYNENDLLNDDREKVRSFVNHNQIKANATISDHIATIKNAIAYTIYKDDADFLAPLEEIFQKMEASGSSSMVDYRSFYGLLTHLLEKERSDQSTFGLDYLQIIEYGKEPPLPVPVVVVLGMTQDNLPKIHAENIILTDSEKMDLQADLPLAKAEVHAEQERL